MKREDIQARIDCIRAVEEQPDEKGSGGLWDLAAEIALAVASYLQENQREDMFLEPFYPEEFGQEAIYNILTSAVIKKPVTHNVQVLDYYYDSAASRLYFVKDVLETGIVLASLSATFPISKENFIRGIESGRFSKIDDVD